MKLLKSTAATPARVVYRLTRHGSGFESEVKTLEDAVGLTGTISHHEIPEVPATVEVELTLEELANITFLLGELPCGTLTGNTFSAFSAAVHKLSAWPYRTLKRISSTALDVVKK